MNDEEGKTLVKEPIVVLIKARHGGSSRVKRAESRKRFPDVKESNLRTAGMGCLGFK